MPIQKRTTLGTVPTDILETPDFDIQGNDYGEIPIVHENTVLTDERAIHARKNTLARSKKKLQNADLTTKRDTIDQHEERVNKYESSPVIRIHSETDKSKRELIEDLVDTSVERPDDRLLSAIFYADSHEKVTEITTSKKFAMFDLTDDTHIEATNHGDCIVIQRRGNQFGHEICRSFPETTMQEAETLEAVKEAIRRAT